VTDVKPDLSKKNQKWAVLQLGIVARLSDGIPPLQKKNLRDI